MGKSSYDIAFVERGKEALWRAFWDSPRGPTEQAIEANAAGSLGRTEIVEAKNLKEAMAIVAARHPDCVVIEDACGRIG